MSKRSRARDALITANLGLVYAAVLRLRIARGSANYDDAVQEGMVALCKAADSHDAAKATFSTWASIKIFGAVKDWLGKESRAEPAYPPCTVQPVDEAPSAEEVAADKQSEAYIAARVDNLPREVQHAAKAALAGALVVETAARTGVSRNTCLRRRAEARRLLLPLRTLIKDSCDE